MSKTKMKPKTETDSDLRISAIKHKIGELERLVDSTTGTEEQITKLKDELQRKIAEFAFTTKLHDSFKEEHLPAWLQRPYALFKDRSKENEWILAVPRFLDFQLGWLEDQDEAWNYFRINRYIDFLIELPDYLKEALGIRRIELPLKLEGQILVTDPLFDEKLTLRYGKYLLQKIEPGKYRINPKMHLDLVANMIRDGILPYSPSPIDEADLSDRKSPFKLEPWQERAWEAFKKYGNIGLYWPTGGGKCHSKGQPILMFDGSVKKVEDVRVGDLLMGPDSKPRTVLSLARGKGKMVRVSPVKGESFVVNEDHMLTLTCTSKDVNIAYHGNVWNKRFDLSIKDFMSLSRSKRSFLKLIRTGVDFPPSKRLPLSPFFLGVFLGDGYGNGTTPSITTSEERIVEEIEREAIRFGLKVTKVARLDYYIGRGRRGRNVGENPITRELRKLGLWGKRSSDKFIPFEYKVASRKNRLDLLAGLLDTDGSLAHNSYDYITKSSTLADDVLFLVRSLGLAGYKSPCRKRSQNGTEGTYYRITISGNTDMIPVRLERKKASRRKQRKDVLRTGLSCVPFGTAEYYGFNIDGDGRYLLGDFTVTHNSRFMQWLVTKLKGPHLIFVHSATLREQWQNAMNEFGVPPSEYQIVTYQSIRRIYSEMSKTKNPFTLLIFEEHHHLPADTFSLASLIPSKYRIGGTGSPFREDHREDLIFALTGVPQGLSWSEFLQFGVIHKPEVHLYIVKTVEDKLVLTDDIVRSKDEKTIVFVFRLAIGRKVASLLNAPFLSGETPPNERITKAKTERVVVMSAVGSEGLSIQDLQRVVEVDFLFGSRTEEIQRLGRLLHSEFKGEHHVLMTEEEYSKYKKRLYPILEKGYDIIVHHAGRYETFVGTPMESPSRLESPRQRPARFRAESTRAQPIRRSQRREPAAATETLAMPGLSSVSSLPGVQKLLSRLSPMQQKCLKVMLDRDQEWFTIQKLSLYTGYSVGSLQNLLQLGELMKAGFLERGHEKGQRGQFRVNMNELPKRLGL